MKNAPLQAFALGLSDVWQWIVWRRSLGRGNELRDSAEEDSRIRLG